ncbi:hypothetical protein M422DRAFT_53656 [Sphaerobolus stellatus SS14]|uniref:Ubiquitin-like protease family profile domain-containing protein n=1 Tax=Sphaerobolus stellatus (strain SS14) TaxID=990650 RepID=A0A0C9UZR4_SPHS4|nr:hypothetical protein M422DRAFT_53656 [Sphaerobolus stellatus SS14]
MPPKRSVNSLDGSFYVSSEDEEEANTMDESLAFKFVTHLHHLRQSNYAQMASADLECLEEEVWWNDRMVDYALSLWFDRFLLSETAASKSTRVYTTHFYNTYTKDGYEGVTRWTRRHNPFDYDNIVFPVHLGNHWVSIIICNSLFVTSENPEEKCQILSLDSLDDPCLKIRETFLEWLLHDAEKRKMDVVTHPVIVELKVNCDHFESL